MKKLTWPLSEYTSFMFVLDERFFKESPNFKARIVQVSKVPVRDFVHYNTYKFGIRCSSIVQSVFIEKYSCSGDVIKCTGTLVGELRAVLLKIVRHEKV